MAVSPAEDGAVVVGAVVDGAAVVVVEGLVVEGFVVEGFVVEGLVVVGALVVAVGLDVEVVEVGREVDVLAVVGRAGREDVVDEEEVREVEDEAAVVRGVEAAVVGCALVVGADVVLAVEVVVLEAPAEFVEEIVEPVTASVAAGAAGTGTVVDEDEAADASPFGAARRSVAGCNSSPPASVSLKPVESASDPVSIETPTNKAKTATSDPITPTKTRSVVRSTSTPPNPFYELPARTLDHLTEKP